MPRPNGIQKPNGRVHNNSRRRALVAAEERPHVVAHLGRDQLSQIRENRSKHIRCMELCRQNKDALSRIARDGPKEGDGELLKAAAALALWEIREQEFVWNMYLDERAS